MGSLVEDRTNAMFDAVKCGLSELNGAELDLTRSMLHTWCWLTVQVDALEKQVNDDGALVDTPKGPKEHPAIQTIHKLTQRKSDYYTKLMRRLSSKGKEQMDSISDFLKSNG